MSMLTSNSLLSAIKKEHIRFLVPTKKEEIIFSLVQCLEDVFSKESLKEIYEKVIQREKVISTGIGVGVAIPHAKIDQADDFSIVIGVIDQGGVNWDAIDGLFVRFVVLIIGPQSKHKEYLKLLSELTTMIKREGARQSLFLSKTEEEVVKIFENC